MERDDFVAATGLSNAQITGINILKDMVYKKANTSALTDSVLGTNQFVQTYAQGLAGSQQNSADIAAGLLAGAEAIKDWRLINHKELSSGLSVMLLRDASNKLWLIADGVDLIPPSNESALDLRESAKIIANGGGFDPRNSRQAIELGDYFHDVINPECGDTYRIECGDRMRNAGMRGHLPNSDKNRG